MSRNATSHSWTQGTVVQYNPQRKGGFYSGQDALDHVANGGILRIVGDWDTAVDGKLELTRGITIEGGGWSREWIDDGEGGSTLQRYGGRIINDVDDNAISVDAPDINGVIERIDGFHLRNIAIDHTGASSPAIRIEDCVYPTFNRVAVECKGLGSTAIRFLGGTFFIQVHDLVARDWADYGVKHEGAGGSNLLQNAHIKSDVAGATAALYSETEISTIAGQINCKDGSGIQLRANGANERGGFCFGTWFEKGQLALDVDNITSGIWTGYRMISPHFTLDSSDADRLQAGVRFKNAVDCSLADPQGVFNAGVLAAFGSGADLCKLETRAGILTTVGVTVSAADSPTRCRAAVPEATDTEINTATDGIDASVHDDVRVEVGFNSTVGAPVFRAAGAWYSQDITGYTP